MGVPDPYDFRSPYHRWQRSFTTAELTRALGARGTFRRLKVLKRGTSPRVVRAQVIGSRGTTTISGPTIRARLGLRDTWMRFTRVSTSAHSAAKAQAAAWTSPRIALWTLAASPRASTGSFDPAPRSHRLILERRIDGRWKRAGAIRTAAHGRYRKAVRRPGVYRVRAGVVAGPPVRVR